MEIYEAVLVYIATAIMMVTTFWFARRLSSRVEERAEKIRELRKKLDVLEEELQEKNAVIDGKQREIDQLKSTLAEKDKKIAELEDRIRFAEKVSERDLEKIRERISEIQANLQSIIRAAEEEGKRK